MTTPENHKEIVSRYSVPEFKFPSKRNASLIVAAILVVAVIVCDIILFKEYGGVEVVDYVWYILIGVISIVTLVGCFAVVLKCLKSESVERAKILEVRLALFKEAEANALAADKKKVDCELNRQKQLIEIDLNHQKKLSEANAEIEINNLKEKEPKEGSSNK